MSNDCENLYHLESLMKNAFSDPEVVFYSNDEKEDKLHDVQVSLESIYAWKRHLLRAVHQDRARQEVLDEVDSRFCNEILATPFQRNRWNGSVNVE